MINTQFFSKAKFVLHWGAMLAIVGLSTIFLGLQLAINRSNTVAESDVKCNWNSTTIHAERLVVNTVCQGKSGTINAVVTTARDQLLFVNNPDKSIMCNIMTANRAENCNLP